MSEPAGPPPVPPEPGMAAAKPNLSMVADAVRAIHEQVRFADAKASFIAAPGVVLFAQMASQADRLLAIGPPDRHVTFWAAAAFVAAYAVTALTSLMHVVLAVMPRQVSLAGEGGTVGRTHFRRVVARYGTDHARYAADLRGMSDADWADDMAAQLLEVSMIADRKHALVRRAALWMAASLAAWVAAVGLVTLAR